MRSGTNRRRTASLLFCATLTLLGSNLAFGQAPTPAPTDTQTATPAATGTPNAPSSLAATFRKDCEEPEPTFTGLEYNGPFKKLVVHIAGKPEIKTVHRHEGQGRICTLPVKKKFDLF